MSESRGRYNRVIKLLLAFNHNVIALKKALEYGERVTIKGFQVRSLAHKCVRFYMSKEDKSFVKEVITNQLQSKVLELKYLESNGFHDDVLKMHATSGQYNEVLEYAWKYRLHDQWLEIALMYQDNEIFLLPIIYAQLAEGSSDNAKRLLQHMQRKRGTEVYRAQVLLLQAKLYSDKVACKEAIKNFKKLHNEGGVIEAVNILYDMDKNPSDVIDVLKYLLRAIRLSNVFKKSSMTLSQNESGCISSYLDLNQMQKLPNGSILVPTYQAYWLQIKSEKCSISKKELAQKVEEHLKSYREKWLTKSNAVEKVSLQCTSLLEEKLSAFSDDFNTYLCHFGRILEFHEKCGCFPDSEIIKSSILLVPLNTLNILQNCTWQREHLQYVQAHTCILNRFKAEYEKVLEEQRKLHFNSLDQCMQLWRLSLITTGNTKELIKNLKDAKVPNEFRAHSGIHVFRSWADFTFPKSSATAFVCNTNDGLLQKLACSPHTFASMSDENLLYILILQSIFSIFLMATQEKDKKYFVPQIFSLILENFHILAWQCPSKDSAIVELEYQMEMERKLPIRLGHLAALNILAFILDKDKPRLLSHGDNTVTTYYFILICTIIANLIIAAKATPDDDRTNSDLILIVEKLKLIGTTPDAKTSVAASIYKKLIDANSVKGIFRITDELLRTCPAQNQNMNQIQFDEDKNVIKCTRPDTLYPDDLYPDIQLKLAFNDELQTNASGPIKQLPERDIKSHPVTMKQEETFLDMLENHKLKSPMIENSYCTICTSEIQLKSQRQHEDTSTPYEKHFHNKNHWKNLKFTEQRDRIEQKMRKASNDLKKLHPLHNLSPDDDIILVQLDKKLSQMQSRIESITNLEDLEEIQEELKNISQRTPLKINVPHVSFKAEADDVIVDLLGKKKTSK